MESGTKLIGNRKSIYTIKLKDLGFEGIGSGLKFLPTPFRGICSLLYHSVFFPCKIEIKMLTCKIIGRIKNSLRHFIKSIWCKMSVNKQYL